MPDGKLQFNKRLQEKLKYRSLLLTGPEVVQGLSSGATEESQGKSTDRLKDRTWGTFLY